jgi:hypothetical protein
MKVLSIFRGRTVPATMLLTDRVLKNLVGDSFAMFEESGYVFVYNPDFYLHKNKRVTMVYDNIAFAGRVIVIQIDEKNDVVPFELVKWKKQSSKFRVFDGKHYEYYYKHNIYSFDYSGLNEVSPLDYYIGVYWQRIEGGNYYAVFDDDDELFDEF